MILFKRVAVVDIERWEGEREITKKEGGEHFIQKNRKCQDHRMEID